MTEPVLAAFTARYGASPAGVVAAPGRVNIIGEHTDYSRLPVLPMAIQHRLEVAYAPRQDGVVEAISLLEPGRFRSDSAAVPSWGRYLASALAVLGEGDGARLLVGGDLPAGGGLSSSSALTLAVVTALATVRGRALTAADLVATAVLAERGIGVEGGAMDQTVIVHARPGHALRIDFEPPEMRHVPVPEGLVFVVGYSGTDAGKGLEAMDGYNARVVGCRSAAAVLASRAGRDISPPSLRFVADLDSGDLPERATAREAAALAGCDLGALVDLTVGSFDADRPLPLRAYARHVLSEAIRVDQAEDRLRSGDGRGLGAILDDSHRSLASDFSVSSPGLDQLTEVARTAGAFGARLTGAGFGGWALAVTDPRSAAAVAEAMAGVGGASFVARPSAGLR